MTTESPATAGAEARWRALAEGALYVFVVTGIVLYLGSLISDFRADLRAEAIAADAPESDESKCRTVFNDRFYHYSNGGKDERRCAAFVNVWAKALPDTKFSINGSALLLPDSVYSLAGAQARLSSMTYADTELPTVVIDWPERSLTLRFQSQESAKAALADIGDAMGRIGLQSRSTKN